MENEPLHEKTCPSGDLKICSAPARIRKGQGAEAMNRALCVASQKLGYTGGGNGRG